MTPVITIGIPFFNAKGTLHDCLRSVFAQTFTQWELLLVDDGSTDGSLEIAQSVNDRRAHVISDGTNRGLVYRLNQMIDRSQAPYFARMDADDLMHPERLTRQLDYLRQHPEVEIIGSAAYVIDREGQPYGIRGDRPASLTASIQAGFIHPTVMATTGWFRRHRYDAEFVRAEDLALWRRADSGTKCARLREPLLFYREPLEFQPAKYRVSCQSIRKLARRYPPSGGWASSVSMIAGTYVKEAAHLALDRVGLVSALVRRRNRNCEDFEIDRAHQILRQIGQVGIPGAQLNGVSAAGLMEW